MPDAGLLGPDDVGALRAEIVRLEEQLGHERLHDPLTGLPTRPVFIEHLQRALRRAARLDSTLAVFGLDLDGLSLVNEDRGHDCGDEVLIRVGQSIDGVLRAGDTVAQPDAVVARFEDSYFVLYEDVADLTSAAAVAVRLAEAARQDEVPGSVDGIVANATVGVVLSSSGTSDAESLLVDVTSAMHAGKRRGGDRVEFFDKAIRRDADRRINDLRELRVAIEKNQLRLFYQPKVDIVSGRVLGVEALVRWQHPRRGLVSAAGFIPLAEDTGLILPLGEWVLMEACRQRARWCHLVADQSMLLMSVNISRHQFNASFPDLIDRVFAETHAPSGSLCIEVTETAVMRDVEAAIITMRRLRDLGVRMSIDDFGIGYSSLAQLKRLPLDELKIDQSFVERLGLDREDTAIVTAIVTMAKALGLSVTAEGVETPEQLAQLRALGCELAQGFLFSRALPPDEIERLLTTRLEVGSSSWHS